VLRANGNPQAGEILATGHRLLQEQAGRIPDEALRRSFLENVAENRELAAEFAAANSPRHVDFGGATIITPAPG
jgi:hypothetical protein